MEAARTLFAQANRSEHLRTEAFTLTQFTAEAGTVDGTVRFGASERAVASDGTPLLLQAEAAGLTPLTGCRMGICHTCTRRLCAGVVRDAVTGELTNGPDVNIRICVSVPVGDVEIDL
jgi:ferredoxin